MDRKAEAAMNICSMVEICAVFGSSELPPLGRDEKCPHRQPHHTTHGCCMAGGCTWSDMRRETEYMRMENACVKCREKT